MFFDWLILVFSLDNNQWVAQPPRGKISRMIQQYIISPAIDNSILYSRVTRAALKGDQSIFSRKGLISPRHTSDSFFGKAGETVSQLFP